MYQVTLFTDSSKPSSTASTPHRLCKITFKEMPEKDADGNIVKNADGTKKVKHKHANRCVSIPCINVMIQPDSIKEALQDKFNDLQDAVIKEFVIAALDAGLQDSSGKLKPIVISDEQISLEACAKFHAASNTGKLSKDVLNEWFTSDLADNLMVKLAAAMKLPAEPTAAQLAALEAGTAEYKAMFAGLAAPKATLPIALAKQLNAALKLATDSRIKVTLADKLQTIMQPAPLALSIGFADDDADSLDMTSN